MRYHLTLPKGQIKLRGNVFVGSNTEGEWSPVNPMKLGGWKKGDELTVTCTFNTQPEGLPRLPDANEYFGLSVAALNNPTEQEIQNEIRKVKSFSAGQALDGITNSDNPANSIFYKAKSETVNIPLQPSSRGTIQNIVYDWHMVYTGNEGLDPNNIELIFGYGDPMDSEERT